MMTSRRIQTLAIIFFLYTPLLFSHGIILSPDSIAVIKQRPLKQICFTQNCVTEEISITTRSGKPIDIKSGKFDLKNL